MTRYLPALMIASCASLGAQNGAATATIERPDTLQQRIADTDGDGRDELLLVRAAADAAPAAVLRIGFDLGTGNTTTLRQRDSIELTDAAHSLLTVADVLPTPGLELIVTDPRGTACLPWPTPATPTPAPITLHRRAKFRVRVGQPQLSPFVLDLNQDGELDLMVPSLSGVTPYLHDGRSDDGRPSYRRLEPVAVPVRTNVEIGSSGLDAELKGSVQIPRIRTQDVNGDGKPDLLTTEGQVHAFHLQNADGTFAAPIRIDIGQFEDSTPKAVVDLGNTLVLGDRQLLQRGDVDGDGIPDYVIAHRRKIWTFLASTAGPQFRKPRTQAVADDVTAMLVVDLDDDDRSDLLTFRVRLPSLGTFVLALVRSVDIDVKAVGYQSEGNGFARKPKWRRTLTLRIPPLLSLLSRQDELVERFTDLIGKTRISARGHFSGGQELDVAIVSEDGTRLELLTDVGPAPRIDGGQGAALLRRLLFEEDQTVFDIERVFSLLSGLVDRINARTGRARARGSGATAAAFGTGMATDRPAALRTRRAARRRADRGLRRGGRRAAPRVRRAHVALELSPQISGSSGTRAQPCERHCDWLPDRPPDRNRTRHRQCRRAPSPRRRAAAVSRCAAR